MIGIGHAVSDYCQMLIIFSLLRFYFFPFALLVPVLSGEKRGDYWDRLIRMTSGGRAKTKRKRA